MPVSVSVPSHVVLSLPRALFPFLDGHDHAPVREPGEFRGHDHDPFHVIFREVDLYLQLTMQNHR